MGSVDDELEKELEERSERGDGHPMLPQGQVPAVVPAGVEGQVDRNTVLAGLGLETSSPLHIGRYVVLQTLGRGGMGTVYKAYDAELDRAVAIKVLHSAATECDAGRLRREALALAKLSHSNVVQVYEVGQTEGQTFIVMELVRGQTLAEWAKSEPRPEWRQCVRVYLQAGAGLAAAHTEGLVHRDFKPANAVIDDKGHVWVLDFGLARQADDTTRERSDYRPDEFDSDSSELELPLTRTGDVVGTPAYMPLEQLDGRPIDARSDQFSFCVSLWEAVYGERPFPGESVPQRRAELAAGLSHATIPSTGVPARLRRVLARGLAAEPEARWPSMEVLLNKLRRVATPRGRGLAILGMGVLGGLGLGLVYRSETEQHCKGARAQLDGVWDEGRRQMVRDAILGTELPYAVDTWQRIEARLDDYAEAWVSKHHEVCEATALRKEQSEDVMDLRMGCLFEQKAALGAAVKELARADEQAVRNAVDLVTSLPSLTSCDDIGLLSHRAERVPPPEGLLVAQSVGELRERLAEIEVEQELGQYARALRNLEPVLEKAESLGYMPLIAEAELQQGRLQEDAGLFTDAERHLLQAHATAVEYEHDDVAFEAAKNLAYLVSNQQARHSEGLVWARFAEPLAKRSNEQLKLASIMDTQGTLLHGLGRYEEAEQLFERALRIRERELGTMDPLVAKSIGNLGVILSRVGNHEESEHQFRRALEIQQAILGPNHPDVAGSTASLGNALYAQGRYEEAERLLRRALEVQLRALGTEHPDVAGTMANLGRVLYDVGRYEDALDQLRRAIRIQERVLGEDHPDVAGSLASMASVFVSQARYEEAERQFRRALEIGEKALGKEHPAVATFVSNLANTLYAQGRYAQAERHFRRAMEIWEKTLGKEHPNVAVNSTNLADMLVSQGRFDEAEPLFLRALSIQERALGPDHPELAWTLLGLARVDLEQSRPEEARRRAERAVSLRESGKVAPELLADARFLLARALSADLARGAAARRLAELARDAFARGGDATADDLAEVQQWLTEQYGR